MQQHTGECGDHRHDTEEFEPGSAIASWQLEAVQVGETPLASTALAAAQRVFLGATM